MQNRLADLTPPTNADGDPRRVGIEVECSGLTEREVADLIVKTLGGTAGQTAQYDWTVEGTELGRFHVHLDTALRGGKDTAVTRVGLDLGRAVIPVEYVTDPILPAELATLERLNAALAQAGALGTSDGIALGFGVHLNVALAGEDVEHILPTLRAFAFIEDWLRGELGIDTARRALPFVSPYPAALLDELAMPEATHWTLGELTNAYLTHAASRNHALDLLPALMQVFPDRVIAAVPAMAGKSARPAWHYRLPDCRIDDPDWSLGLEWNRWCAIERIAADTDLVAELMSAWREYRGALGLPGRWAGLSGPIVTRSGAFL